MLSGVGVDLSLCGRLCGCVSVRDLDYYRVGCEDELGVSCQDAFAVSFRVGTLVYLIVALRLNSEDVSFVDMQGIMPGVFMVVRIRGGLSRDREDRDCFARSRGEDKDYYCLGRKFCLVDGIRSCHERCERQDKWKCVLTRSIDDLLALDSKVRFNISLRDMWRKLSVKRTRMDWEGSAALLHWVFIVVVVVRGSVDVVLSVVSVCRRNTSADASLCEL
ncbi:hypothetical protein Tco_0121046 [Tanacetum coccineum]